MINFPKFGAARSGATMVEFGLLAPVVMVVLIAVVELSVFVWQWNSAQRAVRAGARMASMSLPVSNDIANLASSTTPGSQIGNYSISCDGSTKTCTSGNYNSVAMNRILNGGDGMCSQQTKPHLKGLCDMMPGITEANILIEYRSSLSEIARAPGGIQPIITLRLKNVGLAYTPLAMFGGSLTKIPDTSTTVLGQDLGEGGWTT